MVVQVFFDFLDLIFFKTFPRLAIVFGLVLFVLCYCIVHISGYKSSVESGDIRVVRRVDI